MKKLIPILFLLLAVSVFAEDMQPILDMHLHAATADINGPPPIGICVPRTEFPTLDPAKSWAEVFGEWLKHPPCANPIWGSETDEKLMNETLDILRHRNIYAVTSGEMLDRWKKEGGERIIPALGFGFLHKTVPSPAEVRQWFQEKRYRAFAEVSIQYDGISPSDAVFEPYLSAAEEFDIPMGIHIGTGPPGAVYLPGVQNYRARLHSPLVLEEALVRHPKLRVYIMHAGWPMLDDLLAVLYAHPQVYIDVAVINYILPRKEFHRYVQRIVEAGFEKRVMFGSDQMSWPKTIIPAIESITSADFLTAEQKRDILYNNAARFLRLSKEEMDRQLKGIN